MTKNELKSRMKRLARKFCRRNSVYSDFDTGVGKLVERAYLSAYLLCLHEQSTTLANCKAEIIEMKRQLGKAKELILKLYIAGRDVVMCRAREEKAFDNLTEAINDRSIERFLEEVK